MAKLKNFIRIVTNDYPKEIRSTIEKLAGPINDAFSELYFVLNNRVSLSENIACTVATVEVIVNSSGVPINTTRFNLSNAQPVIGCDVKRAQNQTNTAVYPTGAPFISYTQFNNTIQIDHVTGLQANQRYLLKIVAYN